MSAAEPLWTPSETRTKEAPITAFAERAEALTGKRLPDYAALHAWSVEDREGFWSLLWDFCGVIGDRGERVLVDGDRMPGASFFPDATLNFAENLLRKSGDGDAVVFRGEDKDERRLSWDELRNLVSKLQQLFRDRGLKAGDRVAAMMPNMPETLGGVVFLLSRFRCAGRSRPVRPDRTDDLHRAGWLLVWRQIVRRVGKDGCRARKTAEREAGADRGLSGQRYGSRRKNRPGGRVQRCDCSL